MEEFMDNERVANNFRKTLEFIEPRGKTVDSYRIVDSLGGYEIELYTQAGGRFTIRTDRISVKDMVIEGVEIPLKGVCNALSTNCLKRMIEEELGIPTDLVDGNQASIWRKLSGRRNKKHYVGRMAIVHQAISLKIEAIVRRYNTGSFKKALIAGEAWATVFDLPRDLKEYTKFLKDLFTPSIKKGNGEKDDNVLYEEMVEKIREVLKEYGLDLDAEEIAKTIEEYSLRIFAFLCDLFEKRGLTLADAKFEFGLIKRNGKYIVVLIDEISSDTTRIWKGLSINPGETPKGLDKDYARKSFEQKGYITPEAIRITSQSYLEFVGTMFDEPIREEYGLA